MRKKYLIMMSIILMMVLVCTGCANSRKATEEGGQTKSVKEADTSKKEEGCDLNLDRAYVTRFSDVNQITYPKFVFNYPSNWRVIDEQVDENGESITLKNDDGIEIIYNYMNLPEDFNFGMGTTQMLRVDVSEIEKSNFKPGYVQATDYADIGKFMVSELHVTGQIDMQTGTEYEEINGDISYAVLPQSMKGTREDVRGPFSGEFSFEYGGYISMICSPQVKLDEKQEKEVVEILKSFRKLEDSKEIYPSSTTENAIRLSEFLNGNDSAIMYYFNLDNIYDRNDIVAEVKADTLSKVLVFEKQKVNEIFITHHVDNWETVTLGEILQIPNEELQRLAAESEARNFIIAGYTNDNGKILEKEKIWMGGENSATGVPDFVSPIELTINGNYYAGFWSSDSRGSQLMIFQMEEGKYFTFDKQKEVLINPTDEDVLKAFK